MEILQYVIGFVVIAILALLLTALGVFIFPLIVLLIIMI